MSSVALSSRDTGRRRGAARGARRVPPSRRVKIREVPFRAGWSPEQRWTTPARPRDNDNGAYAAANAGPRAALVPPGPPTTQSVGPSRGLAAVSNAGAFREDRGSSECRDDERSNRE